VLDAPASGGLIGWAHDFHESLALREYSGREIVGCVGIAMLVSSLSGIYLWWPRRPLRRNDFTFRRGPPYRATCTLTFGIYASLVLAMLSFTGIFLAFPMPGARRWARWLRCRPRREACRLPNPRAGRSRRTKPSPSPARDFRTRVSPASACRRVRAASYRIALARARRRLERGGIVIFVDPRRERGAAAARSGDANERRCVSRLPAPAARRRCAGIRRDASSSASWALLPALFVVTGTMMWLRSRRSSGGPRLTCRALRAEPSKSAIDERRPRGEHATVRRPSRRARPRGARTTRGVELPVGEIEAPAARSRERRRAHVRKPRESQSLAVASVAGSALRPTKSPAPASGLSVYASAYALAATGPASARAATASQTLTQPPTRSAVPTIQPTINAPSSHVKTSCARGSS
jgi:hypothetical protein